jgi:general stress protein CsbA
VLANVTPVCIVVLALDLDNDLISGRTKETVTFVVANSGNYYLLNKSLVTYGAVCTVGETGVATRCSVTVNSYGSVAVCGKNLGGNDNYGLLSAVYGIVVNNGLRTVSGTSSLNYLLLAISKSNVLNYYETTVITGVAELNVVAINLNRSVLLLLVASSLTGNNYAGMAITVVTLSDLALLELTHNSVVIGNDGLPVGVAVVLCAVLALLEKNVTYCAVDEPSVGPLTVADAGIVKYRLLLALDVANRIGVISVLGKTAGTCPNGVTLLSAVRSYNIRLDVELVSDNLPLCVATVLANAKCKTLRGHGVLTAGPYFILECVILAIGKILTLGANAKILIANPPVAVRADVRSKTSNALLALLALNACGALKTLVALIALLACATSNESCTNHEDHHYNCKQFNNVLVHSKISP